MPAELSHQPYFDFWGFDLYSHAADSGLELLDGKRERDESLKELA